MNEKTAQATPSTGASNASDFQPPTQNPQNIPGGVVQQQSNLQGIKNTQEFFNDSQNATIKVTSEPAPARAAVQPTNDASVLAVLLVVAAVTGYVLMKLVNRFKNNSVQETSLETEAPEPKVRTKQSTTKAATKPSESSKPKKKTASKKSGKKNKRQRR